MKKGLIRILLAIDYILLGAYVYVSMLIRPDVPFFDRLAAGVFFIIAVLSVDKIFFDDG